MGTTREKKNKKKRSRKGRSRGAGPQAPAAALRGRTCVVCGAIEVTGDRCPTCGAEVVTVPWMGREVRLLRLAGTVCAGEAEGASTERTGEDWAPRFELALDARLRLRVEGNQETRFLGEPGLDLSRPPEAGSRAEVLGEVHEVFEEPAGLREAPRRLLLVRAAMLAVGAGGAAELSRAIEALQKPEPERKPEVGGEAQEPGPSRAKLEPDARTRWLPLAANLFLAMGIVAVLSGGYGVLVLVADCTGHDRLAMTLEKTRWRLGAAALVESNPPALLIQMYSSRTSRYRLLTLAVKDGRRLGERLDPHGPLDLLAVTSDGLWSNRSAGYRLPWLDDHPGVRPADQTREWKRCKQRPPALLDTRDCRLLLVDGDAIGLEATSRGPMLGRRPASGAPRWERTIKDLFGAEGRSIRFATLHAGRLYLIAEEGEEEVDDLYVVAIDAGDGRTVWSQVFW